MENRYANKESIESYMKGPELEQGQSNNADMQDDKDKNLEHSFILSAMKSLMLTPRSPLSKTPNISNVSRENIKREEVSYLEAFNDPIHFLKEQINKQTADLGELEKTHKEELSSGTGNVNVRRTEILSDFKELAQSNQAIKEIYASNAKTKQESLDRLVDRQNRERKLLKSIRDIEENTVIGKNYKILNSKMVEIDSQILDLERKVRSLKREKELVAKQLSENESLLEVKVNAYREVLEGTFEEEKLDVNKLYQSGILPKGELPISEVIENIRLQIEAVKELEGKSELKESGYHNSYVYLSDIFERLTELEEKIITFINEGKIELIESQLRAMKKFLQERIKQCDQYNLDVTKQIIQNEFGTILRALSMISNDSVSSSQEEFEEIEIPKITLQSKEEHVGHSKDQAESFDQLQSSIVSTHTGDKTQQTGLTNVVAQGKMISKPQNDKKYSAILERMRKTKGTKKD